MRIIGIDPGSRKTGYGIIDVQGNSYKYVECGVINASKYPTIAERIKHIFTELTTVVANFKPEVAGIEQVFMHVNPDSALKLGQARGAAIAALVSQNLKIHEYSATQIKSRIVGKGHGSKTQVQFMVKYLLKLSFSPEEDAADGIACALCLGFSLGTSALNVSNNKKQQ